MATIIGAGQRYDRIIGVGGVTTSIDGFVWSSQQRITQPFPAGMRAQGIATNGDGSVFVAVSDNGWAAYSEDLLGWDAVRLLDSSYTALGVSWSDNGGSRPLFAIAGSTHYDENSQLVGEYSAGDQVATILINETGDRYPWEQAFTHPQTNSWFNAVRWFPSIMINGMQTGAWVAVGQSHGQPDIWYTEGITWTYGVSSVSVTDGGSGYSYADVSFANGGGQDATATAEITGGVITAITVITPGSRYDVVPDVIISGDGMGATASAATAPIGPPDPYTWQPVTLPAAYANRPLYDVAYHQGRLYFSGRGMIISTADMLQGTWETSRFITTNRSTADFLQLAINPDGHAVAVSSGGIIYSRDLISWTLYGSGSSSASTTVFGSSLPEQGYQFASVVWFNDHWIVGAYSLLTQFTYFTSSDGTIWTARNNAVQMYSMAVSDRITVDLSQTKSMAKKGTSLFRSALRDQRESSAAGISFSSSLRSGI